MDKKSKEDLQRNFSSKDPKSKYVTVNGRLLTTEEYRKNPTYYNNLPIEPNYLKRVKGDYESNQ